ncbi:MAG: MoaD family protein [Candidatus Hodarchaeota archaeon]
MINIKASFLSLLADVIGKEEVALSFDNTINVKDILMKLSLMFGKDFEENIFSAEGELSKYIILGLNGKDIRKFDGLNTIIEDGDIISFLPAIAGG